MISYECKENYQIPWNTIQKEIFVFVDRKSVANRSSVQHPKLHNKQMSL